MMKALNIRVHAVALLALMLAACGGGLLLIPLFEFGFSGSGSGVTFQFFFGPDKPTSGSGAFTFVNVNVSNSAVQIHYTGSYSGCTFTLTTTDVVVAPAASGYSGSFKGNNSIELKPTTGTNLPTLTLDRVLPGSVASGC